MKTNSTLAIFLLAQASALSCARAFIMASMVGCAGAYTPVPQVNSPQTTKQETLIKEPRLVIAVDQSTVGTSTSAVAHKSQPVTNHLTEPTRIQSATLVAQSNAQSLDSSAVEAAQEPTAAPPVKSEQLQPEAALMHTEESITASASLPATPTDNAPEIQLETQSETQSQTETKTETKSETQPKTKSETQLATTTPVSREPGAAARQNLVLERAHTSHAQIVLLGDSITEGWEGAPEQLQALVGLRSAANLGVGGDRTQHVLWRLEQAPLSAIKPKVIVLMIGTNNMYDDSANDIIAGIHAVVELLSAQCPNAEILVLDIPPRGDVQDSAREKIAQINIGLTLGMWPQHARFVRVSNQFLKTDGPIDPVIMPDLLHFSQKGYALWAAAIKPELDCSLAANHPEPAPTTPHP